MRLFYAFFVTSRICQSTKYVILYFILLTVCPPKLQYLVKNNTE